MPFDGLGREPSCTNLVTNLERTNPSLSRFFPDLQHPPRSPPPPLFPHKLEAFLASLTPRQAQQIRASTDSIFWDDVPVFPD